MFVLAGDRANQPAGQPIETTVIFRAGDACIVEVDGERHKVYGCLYLAGEKIVVREYNNGWRIEP